MLSVNGKMVNGKWSTCKMVYQTFFLVEWSIVYVLFLAIQRISRGREIFCRFYMKIINKNLENKRRMYRDTKTYFLFSDVILSLQNSKVLTQIYHSIPAFSA